jgi:hypothetical protein
VAFQILLKRKVRRLKKVRKNLTKRKRLRKNRKREAKQGRRLVPPKIIMLRLIVLMLLYSFSSKMMR